MLCSNCFTYSLSFNYGRNLIKSYYYYPQFADKENEAWKDEVCFLNSLGNGWAGTQALSPHYESGDGITSHQRVRRTRETIKPTKKEKEVNYWALYWVQKVWSLHLVITTMGQMITTSLHLWEWLPWVQGHKLLPQDAFLLGFNTNAEGTGPTTRCRQMCSRNISMVRSPRKEKVGFRKERNSRREDYLDIGLGFTAFVAQPTDGCALGQVSTKEVKPLAFCFFKECQKCRWKERRKVSQPRLVPLPSDQWHIISAQVSGASM